MQTLKTGRVSAHVKQLGSATSLPKSPQKAQLERVPNPHPRTLYLTRFVAPEFTSLCPVTGQPDFAHLVIDYVPEAVILESKSLKLFLGSFRNHGAFHEELSQKKQLIIKFANISETEKTSLERETARLVKLVAAFAGVLCLVLFFVFVAPKPGS